ncbi:Orotidine 5'-phosphate decarboxylase [hydrothermal vent metagenome]|uniref:Orotidine 5'-phosphate decarboxylase n=1 Tax=hydrothermal vent metagenome TaxID=652676 RepID=A0A3B1DGK3_9ZZZZ
MNNIEKLIVALDVPTFEEARKLIDTLSPVVEVFKIGSQLFTACGPVAIRYVLSKGKKVFLDLKFHDIPNTVAHAVSAAVVLGEPGHEMMDEAQHKVVFSEKGLFMLTVHTVGGQEMMERSVEAATKQAETLGVRRPLIIGITVLTSEKCGDNIADIVLERANLAKKSGLDGVVASSQEASLIRQKFGKDFVIVTPGIRPQEAECGDQKRVTTPAEAISNGSDFLVVGRPIVKAEDPLSEAQKILEEIK